MFKSTTGRRPKVIKVTVTSPEAKSAELFEAFLDGYGHIGDSDDLLVAWSDPFGPAFRSLLDLIVNYLVERDVPVHVVRTTYEYRPNLSGLAAEKDGIMRSRGLKGAVGGTGDFVSNGRKGVLLADGPVVQGGEFKSVRIFFNWSKMTENNYSFLGLDAGVLPPQQVRKPLELRERGLHEQQEHPAEGHVQPGRGRL